MDLRGRVREELTKGGEGGADDRLQSRSAGRRSRGPATKHICRPQEQGRGSGNGSPAGAALGRGDELAPLLRRQVEGAMGAGGRAARLHEVGRRDGDGGVRLGGSQEG